MVPHQPMPAKLERRRSQRIPMVKRVEVAWHAEDGTYVTEQAETVDVSSHGGLLRMKHELPLRQVVELIRGRDEDRALARVIRCGPARPDGWTPVAVELAVPSYAFWGVIFPPARPTGTSTG